LGTIGPGLAKCIKPFSTTLHQKQNSTFESSLMNTKPEHKTRTKKGKQFYKPWPTALPL